MLLAEKLAALEGALSPGEAAPSPATTKQNSFVVAGEGPTTKLSDFVVAQPSDYPNSLPDTETLRRVLVRRGLLVRTGYTRYALTPKAVEYLHAAAAAG